MIPLIRFSLRSQAKFISFITKRRYSIKKKDKKEEKKDEKRSKQDTNVCSITDCVVDPINPEPSVLIIGAGIAGLSAAQRLMQCGITNFTILEASDRPGGRIHSCWLGDIIAEMGCQYIRGACCNNPVFNLAAQEGLVKAPERPEKRKIFYCTSEGRFIDNTIAMMAYEIFTGIKNEAYRLFNTGSANAHGSLKNFLYLRIQQELQKFPEEQRYDVSRILYGLTNRIRFFVGDDLECVSADSIGSLINIPGGDVSVPFGFVGVLSPLLRELPEGSLMFNKPVRLIEWGGLPLNKSRAVAHCCDGKKFYADYIIITVSLGVLKEHADKLFLPCLPSSKMQAIKTIGFGNVDKIFLNYDRPFWVSSNGNFRFAWSQDELANRTDWTKGLSSIEEVDGSKHVLCAFISGPEAVVMEQASDEEVAFGITKVLRQFTGDPSLPYPSTVLRSKWASDPYFCGAFSYLTLDSAIDDQNELSSPVPDTSDPVPPILLFAGEATCVGHHSTVHGARLSGIREAERIIHLTKQFSGPPPGFLKN
ncbi:unnamed protein product [Psylliodes chrysocephalus]|uniref:Amine oxidase domain-containing protein n=1 Tax=Psylliodes chrysocephalus TaxID=3402493 RepID=A0A9P0CZ58_9CUCU|nr:unnamed protein product [Psylliodes chrysocephala]